MFNLKTWKDGEHITQRYMKKEGYKIIAFAGSYGVTLKKGKSVITIIAK